MANPSDKPGYLNVIIKLTNRDADYIVNKLVGNKLTGDLASGTLLGGKLSARRVFKAISDLLAGLNGGLYEGNVFVAALNDAGTHAAAVITPTYANTATKTITVTYGTLSIVLTEAATGKQGFARGASLATLCAALVACINAHPVLGGVMLATTNSTVVTLTSKTEGASLPYVLTTSDGTAYAFTQFTGGTLGTARLFRQSVLANKLP